MMTIVRMKVYKITKWEGRHLDIQLSSLSYWIDFNESLCSDSEVRMGSFFNGMVGKGF